MKNLSFQSDTNTLIKKSSDTLSKGNVSPAEASTSDNKSTFKNVLNQQVQAKTSQVDSKPEQPSKPASAIKLESQVDNAEAPADTRNNLNVNESKKTTLKADHLQFVLNGKTHTKTVNNDEKMAHVERTPLEDIALDSKTSDVEKSISDDETEKDIKATNDENSATNGIANPALISSMITDTKQFVLNKTSAAEANTDSATEKHSAIDAEIKGSVLNSALYQAKSTDTLNAVVADDKQTAQSWIDSMLPNTSKTVSNDDFSKMVLNGNKESALKESHSNESTLKVVAMPVNFQSTLQNHAVEAAQQLGSSNVINAYPGKAGWDQAISQKVIWMLGSQEQTATLTLNPPDLGPLQIVINVQNDQANTTFVSDNAEVRQALQDGMDNLRNKMNESGIQLGQANVNSGEQMKQQFQQAEQQSRSNNALSKNSLNSSTESVSVSKVITRTAIGLVDTFA